MNLKSAEYLDSLRAARDFLRYVCRYQYFHGEDEAFRGERSNESEVVLFTRLERQLRALNPELSESTLRHACNALQLPPQTSVATAQQQLHAILFQKHAVPPVRYFNFEQPENNDFLAVEDFHVHGIAARHSVDLAVFVNGIPFALLAFGEANSKAGLHAALQRLRKLRTPHAVPQLCYFPQLQLALQKNFSGAALSGADERAFQAWDDPFPYTWEELRTALRRIPRRESDLPTAQEVALAGLLSPRALLPLLQHFTLFENGAKAKLARVHQFQAVRHACEALRGAEQEPRTCFISHPGSSGKAHTLAWLVVHLCVQTSPASIPILLFTACARLRELVRLACAQHGFEAPHEIAAPAQLVPALRRANSQVFVLTPHTFHEALHGASNTQPLLPFSENEVLLLVDEMHQTNDSALLPELRFAFPKGRILGCTAFPPAKETADTLIHRLTPTMALQHGYLLPVKFEARLPRLHHHFAKQATAASTKNALTTPLAAQRIASLAEDLHEHFSQEIRSNGCKGLVLAANAEEAALYFQELEKRLGACVAIVLPKPQPYEKALTALYRRFARVDELLTRWRDPQDELALLILAECPAPGFAAPVLQAIYVDRPLSGYELLHALALVHTPGSEDKLFGLIIDYYGVTHTLPHELAQFEFEHAEELVAPRFSEPAFEELRALRRELRALFKSYPDAEAVEAWLFALEAPELRRAFMRLWQDFMRLLDQLLPRMQEDFAFMQEVVWIDHVRQQAATFYFDEALAHVAGSKKVRLALDKAARERGLMRVRDMASVHDESFMQEIAAMSSLQAQVLRLQYALMEEIRQNLERDPAFYQMLHQRVSRVVIARRQKQMDDATALQQLREEALRLRAGARLPNKDTQLSAEAQAYWHLLVRYLAPPQSEHGRYEELAARLLATLEPDTHIVDWTIKEDWQREMRRKIKHLLREVDCPQDLLDALTQAVMQLTKARFG